MDLLPDARLQELAQPLDICALLPDHHSRLCGMDRDIDAIDRPLDLDAGDSSPR